MTSKTNSIDSNAASGTNTSANTSASASTGRRTDESANTSSNAGFFHNLKMSLNGSGHGSYHEHDTATKLHPGIDRGITHVRSRNTNTTRLTQALEQYSQQQAQLKQTGQAVAAAFQACLGNDGGPYNQLANDFANAHMQLMSVNPPMPDRLVRESQGDFDARHQRVDSHVSNLTKLRGQVQHYVDKVNKLRADRDQRMASDKPLTQAEMERLDRNVLKARNAEQQYNTVNAQLIDEINGLHLAPVQHLGPALVAFVSSEQIYAAQSNALLSKLTLDAQALDSQSQTWMASQQPLIAPGTGFITNPSLDSVERVDVHHPNVQQRTAAGSAHQHSDNDSVNDLSDRLGTTMLRSEEELRVGTERVEIERIVMRKYVTSEIINVPVTVRKEHLSIDRIALNGHRDHSNHENRTNTNTDTGYSSANTGATTNVSTTTNYSAYTAGTSTGAPMGVPSTTALPSSNTTSTVTGDWDIILSHEQPVVTTKLVPYERVRIRKIAETSLEKVGADLRKENIDFTLAPTAAAGESHATTSNVLVRELHDTDAGMANASSTANRALVSEHVDGDGMKQYANSSAGYSKTDEYGRTGRSNATNETLYGSGSSAANARPSLV